MNDLCDSRPFILIVEDYDDLRDTLTALMKLKGYAVESAADGEEAMSIMQDGERLPDLVITDLRMPHDGWTLRRKMLEDEALASIPAIVLSSTNVRGFEDKLRAVAYFEKPVRLPVLVEAIEKYRR